MTRRIAIPSLLASLLYLIPSGFTHADWPQFQGPNRSGHSLELGLLDKWPENGPPLTWTFRESGVGYSSPAVVGDRLLVTGARGDEEHLICLDSLTGDELWSLHMGAKFDFEGNSWGGGPRATPCIFQPADANTYYVAALGGRGRLI